MRCRRAKNHIDEKCLRVLQEIGQLICQVVKRVYIVRESSFTSTELVTGGVFTTFVDRRWNRVF